MSSATDSLSTAASLPVTPAAALSDWRTLGPWYAAEFLNGFACNVYIFSAALLTKRPVSEGGLGGTPSAALWLSASWGLVYIGVSILSGKLADLWGPRKLLVRCTLAATLIALLALVPMQLHSFALLFPAMALYNLANSLFWPAAEAAITRSPGRLKLSARIGVYNLMWSIGAAVAFFVADPICKLHPAAPTITVASAELLAFLLVAIVAIPATMILPQHVADDEEHGDIQPDPAHAKAMLRMAWLVNPLAHVAIFSVIPLMDTLAARAHMPTAVGSIWSFVRFAGFLLLWVWTGWHYRKGLLLAVYGLLIASFLAMMFIPIPGVLVATQIAFGLCAAFLYASSLYYAMHVSSGSGGHAGMHEALLGSGMAIGPIVGALAGTGNGVNGLPVIAMAIAGVMAVGGVVLVLSGRNRKISA